MVYYGQPAVLQIQDGTADVNCIAQYKCIARCIVYEKVSSVLRESIVPKVLTPYKRSHAAQGLLKA